MRKVIRLRNYLIDSFSLFATLGEKPNITNGDLNNTKVMGTYYVGTSVASSITNSPFAEEYCLTVFTFNDSGRVIQKAIASNGAEKQRFFNGTNWSEWLIIPHFFKGTAAPTSDIGVDGDIYLKKK